MGRAGLLVLTDDLILYVAETLHKEPLFGLLAVAALQQCQHRLRQLLRALVKEQPAIRDRSCEVTYTWNVTRFSMFQTMPTDTKIYSPEFSTAFGHNFRLILFPKGDRVPFLSLYLEVPVYSELSGSQSNLSSWYRRVNMALRIPHPEDARQDINEESLRTMFSWQTRGWGWKSLIDLENVPDMLLNDTLRITFKVTVDPPRLNFHAMSTLCTYRAKEDYVLRILMPSMLRDLKKAFESTDPDLKHPWSLCPSCGKRLSPPCAAAAGMAQTRMQCTVECAGCPVAASHALLRRFVDDRSCNPHKDTWRNWPWPLGDLAVPKPEHFNIYFHSEKMMLRLACDRLRDTAAAHFSRNLDAIL